MQHLKDCAKNISKHLKVREREIPKERMDYIVICLGQGASAEKNFSCVKYSDLQNRLRNIDSLLI